MINKRKSQYECWETMQIAYFLLNIYKNIKTIYNKTVSRLFKDCAKVLGKVQIIHKHFYDTRTHCCNGLLRKIPEKSCSLT